MLTVAVWGGVCIRIRAARQLGICRVGYMYVCVSRGWLEDRYNNEWRILSGVLFSLYFEQTRGVGNTGRQQQRPLVPERVLRQGEGQERSVRAQRSGEMPGSADVDLQQKTGSEERAEKTGETG